MKVLFLDLDGVANTYAWQRDVEARYPEVRQWNPEVGRELLDPVRVARIQRICDATGAVVVLVTGWRTRAPHTVIAELLCEKGLTAPVRGAVRSRFSSDDRAGGTREWLKNHKDITHYVIVDDHVESWFYSPEFKSHMVQPIDGIEDNHVEEAIRILNEVPRG